MSLHLSKCHIVGNHMSQLNYSKTCVKQSLSKRPQIGFQDQLLLNAGQNYCRMILQYFPPSLSYHLSFRSLFYLFLSGRFTQVLLYALFLGGYGGGGGGYQGRGGGGYQGRQQQGYVETILDLTWLGF